MGPCSIARSLVVRILSLVLTLPALAAAETFVCTAGDVGCVIASIAKSNANGPGHDYLYLRAGTYLLTRVDNAPAHEDTNGLPVVTGALTIVGAGQGITLLARDPSAPFFRLLDVAPTGGLTVAYVTLQGGEPNITWGQDGGCVRTHGSFLLYHSTVRECAARGGGGISSRGQLTILHSTIIENYGDLGGGGVDTSGPTLIESSWIGENVAPLGGGIGGGSPSGPLVIRRSVIDGNVAFFDNGGGLYEVGSVEITSSLISDNVSAIRGGGLAQDYGTTTIGNSTLWGNHADIEGGGLYVTEGTTTLQGVAVLYNTAGITGRGSGYGGGIATRRDDDAQVQLDKVWLLGNEASDGPQCVGNVTAQGWVVSGNAAVFDTGSPCD